MNEQGLSDPSYWLDLFPEVLTLDKLELLSQLAELYREWNQKINVISRKDMDQLFERHLLHGMLISKWIQWSADTKILDVGTGGGIPGLPLAILFPDVDFHLVDATGKKIKVVQAISESLNLKNVQASHARVEDLRGAYDFVLARAVAPAEKIIHWTQKLLSKNHRNAVPNGWILLKGGDLTTELKQIPKGLYVEKQLLSAYIDDPYYAEKYLIYIQ